MSSFTVQTLKPRNPLVQACRFRRAGVHCTSAGSRRQRAAAELRRELVDVDRRRHSP